MQTTSLQAEILEVFSGQLGIAVPSVDTDLFETCVLDSMSFVELLFHIETRFSLSLSLNDIEFERFKSVQHIAEFIAESGARKVLE